MLFQYYSRLLPEPFLSGHLISSLRSQGDELKGQKQQIMKEICNKLDHANEPPPQYLTVIDLSGIDRLKSLTSSVNVQWLASSLHDIVRTAMLTSAMTELILDMGTVK